MKPHKKMTLKVIKNGVTKLTIPYVLTNGFPNFQGNYLVSKTATEADGIDGKTLSKKKPTPATEKYYLRLGQNPDGNLLIDTAEEEKKQQEDGERKWYEFHAGSPKTGNSKKWGGCETCGTTLPPGYGRLTFCAMDTGCLRHMDLDGWHVHCADEAACATRVPAARKEQKIQSLLDQAAHERHIALGALTYDADGWLSPEDQQRRHDEGMAKAANLETEAKTLQTA